MSDTQFSNIHVRIPTELRDELRREARRTGEREATVLRNLLRAGLAQQQQHASAAAQ